MALTQPLFVFFPFYWCIDRLLINFKTVNEDRKQGSGIKSMHHSSITYY